jgi:hypothetical protein
MSSQHSWQFVKQEHAVDLYDKTQLPQHEDNTLSISTPENKRSDISKN